MRLLLSNIKKEHQWNGFVAVDITVYSFGPSLTLTDSLSVLELLQALGLYRAKQVAAEQIFAVSILLVTEVAIILLQGDQKKLSKVLCL